MWFLQSTVRWLDWDWLLTGVPICPSAPDLELYTDASTRGWGERVADLSASGLWDTTFGHNHMILLEMEAVGRALQAFQIPLSRKSDSVLLCTGITTVACYFNKQGRSHSACLSRRAEEILLWCQQHQIALAARHVPGKRNIVADALSRPLVVLNTEWTLSHRVLETVWRVWFKLHTDVFATRFSHRLPIYVSPVPDPAAWAVDALSIDWSGLSAYASPPFPLLREVLRKARLERAALILIAPKWPAQPWYPVLLGLVPLS